jgi:N-acetylmuramic acid 6-phosphate etherase
LGDVALEKLLTEQRNPASGEIDRKSTVEILRIINDEDRKIADAVSAAIGEIARATDGIVERLGNGGRLFYIGAGTSGRLGVLDACECRPTYNVPQDLVQGVIAGGEAALSRATEASEDDPSAGAADLRERGLTAKDAVVGIAASGRTPYVLGAMEEAKRLGALTIGISCTPDSQLSRKVEVPIELLSGPEIITGSTRMKAGTATKLVLNMLSTATMIRLGYVYGNLMVNVQPTNEKLRARARRIVEQAAGVDATEAARVLEQAGSVKAAVVMARRGVGRTEAEKLLEKARGVVSRALEINLNG